jgi:small basic protein
MALGKAIVPVGYNGLQLLIDDKTAPLGTFVKIDNLIMASNHELVKRDGMKALGATTFPANIRTMYSFNSELGVITNQALWAYSPTLDKFINKGLTSSPIVISKPIFANSYTQTVPDGSTTTTGIQGFVWEDSRAGVRCSIKDIQSDTFFIVDYSLSITGVKPRVVACDKYIMFFWVETNTLKCVRYDTINMVFSSINNISTIVNAQTIYDTISTDSNVYFKPSVAVVVAESTPQLKLYYWDVRANIIGSAAKGAADSVVLTSTNVDTGLVSLAVITNNVAGYLSVLWHNGADNIPRIQTFNLSGVSLNTSNIALGTATTDAGYTITGSIDSLNNATVIYTTKNTIQKTYQATATNILSAATPTITSGSIYYYNCGLVSKAFNYNDQSYYAISYDSTLQGTYFLVRSDGVPIIRMFAQLSGSSPTKSNCLSTWTINPNKPNTYVGAFLKKTKILAASGTYNTTTSVYSEQVWFTPYNIDNKTVARVLKIAGGFLKSYDGTSVAEQGFHLYPEIQSINVAGAGVIPAGTYSYKCVWEWYDNNGQVVRSQTSVPITTVSGGTHNAILTVNTLPVSGKIAFPGYNNALPVLAVYRTLVGGTTYYRVNQDVSEYVYNTIGAATITYTDNKLDSAISSNAVIYTTGGVFDNIATPSANLLTLQKNRIVLAGCDTDPNVIYYSKEKESGVAIEFSNELSITIDSYGGDITALAGMDDKILIFKKSLIYFIAGTGADKVGNGQFTPPQLVSTDTGCVNPQSIVLTADGIMFQSPKGYYIVDRQMNVSYIGNPVKDFEVYTCTSASNLPDNNRVHFTTAEGYSLIYHTFFKKWTTFSNIPATAATSNQSVWYVAGSTGVFQAVSGQTYDDGNTPIISSIKTSWISIAGIEGFQRIYSILFLGDNQLVTDRLKMNLYYDFREYIGQQLSIQPSQNVGTFGSDNPYGANTYGGTNDGTAQYVARPRQQKCTSIQIEIMDDFPTGARGASFKFSELALVVGVKQGYNKNLSTTSRRFS